MDKSERRKRSVRFVVFLIFCAVIALVTAALATDYWLIASVKKVDTTLGAIAERSTMTGGVSFGLFRGQISYSYGLGERERDIYISCNVHEGRCSFSVSQHPILMPSSPPSSSSSTELASRLVGGTAAAHDVTNHPSVQLNITCPAGTEAPSTSEPFDKFRLSYWLLTLVFAAFVIFWSVVGAIFALINTTYTPIETIYGVIGLYVWNVLAMVCAVLCIFFWSLLYYTHFYYSVLPDAMQSTFTTCQLASLGYSFWLIPTAIPLLMLNVVLLALRRMQKVFGCANSSASVDYGASTNSADMIEKSMIY